MKFRVQPTAWLGEQRGCELRLVSAALAWAECGQMWFRIFLQHWD